MEKRTVAEYGEEEYVSLLLQNPFYVGLASHVACCGGFWKACTESTKDCAIGFQGECLSAIKHYPVCIPYTYADFISLV